MVFYWCLLWWLARLLVCVFLCFFVFFLYACLFPHWGPRTGDNHCIGPKKKQAALQMADIKICISLVAYSMICLRACVLVSLCVCLFVLVNFKIFTNILKQNQFDGPTWPNTTISECAFKRHSFRGGFWIHLILIPGTASTQPHSMTKPQHNCAFKRSL